MACNWVAKKVISLQMNIHERSAAQLRRAAELKEQLEAAQNELASILEGGFAGTAGLRPPRRAWPGARSCIGPRPRKARRGWLK